MLTVATRVRQPLAAAFLGYKQGEAAGARPGSRTLFDESLDFGDRPLHFLAAQAIRVDILLVGQAPHQVLRCLPRRFPRSPQIRECPVIACCMEHPARRTRGVCDDYGAELAQLCDLRMELRVVPSLGGQHDESRIHRQYRRRCMPVLACSAVTRIRIRDWSLGPWGNHSS